MEELILRVKILGLHVGNKEGSINNYLELKCWYANYYSIL